jgi:hypothetical protein
VTNIATVPSPTVSQAHLFRFLLRFAQIMDT